MPSEGDVEALDLSTLALRRLTTRGAPAACAVPEEVAAIVGASQSIRVAGTFSTASSPRGPRVSSCY